MRNKYLDRIGSALVLMFLILASLTATVFAAGGPAPDDKGLLDLARPAFDAIMAGHYIAGAALAVVVAMTCLKRYAPGKIGALANTDAGGALCTLVVSFAGGIAMATAAGHGWGGLSTTLMFASGKIALMAAGGYALIKKLLVEPLMASSWYQNRAPAWLKAVLGVALFFFTRKTEDPGEAATKAGDQAVADKPAGGADSAIGNKPTEL